ncbi:hypothetical protein HSBAA_28390 [Vreelandella sulfidaeris]|uniref:Uncharacterized protein n=1 Tax=Vreelandella sulfidaeris TaxID=115553 RepID=A0A455U8I4_9GAMM|nr:hypothetical protein HSBAA_28390 [Halomonas sulfidaeris]
MQQALSQLPNDGSPRELLAPCDNRWLKVILRRVPGSDRETLLTFSDATASWSSEMGVRAELADMLTPLRQHTASLTSAADALIQLRDQNDASTSSLRQRFERVIHEEGVTLGDNVAKIGQLLDDMQHQGERLTPMWSNDFWQALDERLDPEHRLITPVGMPAWFKGDAPALIALFDSLVKHLNAYLPDNGFEGELCLGNKRVYLDLIWRGKAIPEHELAEWRQQPLTSLPLTPSVADVLRQHASDIWSLADDDGVHARLRLPLPAVERVGARGKPHHHGLNFMTSALPISRRRTKRSPAVPCAAWRLWRLIPKLPALSYAAVTRSLALAPAAWSTGDSWQAKPSIKR